MLWLFRTSADRLGWPVQQAPPTRPRSVVPYHVHEPSEERRIEEECPEHEKDRDHERDESNEQ